MMKTCRTHGLLRSHVKDQLIQQILQSGRNNSRSPRGACGSHSTIPIQHNHRSHAAQGTFARSNRIRSTLHQTEGIRLTNARQVDVSSGVESAPGVKDAARIAAFVAATRPDPIPRLR